MGTRMRVRCFKLTPKTIDRLVKVVFPEIRNPQEEIDSRISRVAGQYLMEQPDGIVKLKFRLLQNAQTLKGLKAVRSKRQGLSVNAFRSGIVSRLFFAARLFEQDFHVALRLRRPGCCPHDRGESTERQVKRDNVQRAMSSQGRAQNEPCPCFRGLAV